MDQRSRSSADEPLLERVDLLAALSGWAGEAVRTGRIVLVTGEAGVGKSALVRRFLSHVPPRTPVLQGGCEALSTPHPLAPLVDVASQSAGPLAEALAADADPLVLSRALLETLARYAGTVLVVEDLHWADDATLDLLRLVSRRIAEVPALVVATYRDDEIGVMHPLRVLVGDLGARPAVRRLQVPPLSNDAVAQLAEGSGINPGDLFQRTGGNAFFVTEVLAARTTGVPETVRDAVLARAARLGARARRVLDTAAVIGSPLDLPLLWAVAAGDTPHLDDCVGAGMLRVDGDQVAFRHELGRIAVEEAISPARRSLLHAAVLRRLGPGASAARLAHHAAGAGDRPAIRRHAEQAAREAAHLGAHREAAAQYRQVLAALDSDQGCERATLLLRHSEECALSDQIEQARMSAEQALRIWRASEDRLHEGNAVRWMSRLAFMSDRSGDAERLARRAIDLLEQLPPGPALARAYATLAQQQATTHKLDEASLWGQRALQLSETLGEQEIALQATVDLGLARALRDYEGGIPELEQAAQRARDRGSDEQAARAMFQLGRVAWQHQRHVEVVQRMLAAEAYCTERGTELLRDYSMAFRAFAHLELGEWSEAEAVARQVWRRTTPASPTVRTVTVCVVLGLLHVRRGTPDSTDFLAVAAAQTRTVPLLGWALGVVAAQAEAAWLAGRLPIMIDGLRVAADLAHDDPVGHPQLAELCWWLRAAGEEVNAHGTGPFVAQAAGDWRAAAAGWQALGSPYRRAQALAGADKQAPLREALAICRGLGAAPLGRRIAQRLRSLGARDIPRIAAGPAANQAGLTARELDVLVLLADGLRDADIAQRLVVSPRTIHHHVSAILVKLDARSRTAAVTTAGRLGLLTGENG